MLHSRNHNRNDDGSMDQPEDLALTQKMVPWWTCPGDDILTIGYIFTQASPSAQPLLFCALFYACALGFKELNETHLHIYPDPMSLTSMSRLCRFLCYRTLVEVK
jgi:hypothetical protein